MRKAEELTIIQCRHKEGEEFNPQNPSTVFQLSAVFFTASLTNIRAAHSGDYL